MISRSHRNNPRSSAESTDINSACRAAGRATEQHEWPDVVQQPGDKRPIVAPAIAACGDLTGGHRTEKAVAPERRHGDEFITDAVEGSDRRESDRQIAHLPHAEHRDRAAEGGDLTVMTVGGAVGDAQ